jgi:parvulin-like peptidyl-prolyl isomerase
MNMTEKWNSINRHTICASVLFLGAVAAAWPVLAEPAVAASAAVQTAAPASTQTAASGVAAETEPVGRVYVKVNGKPITVREYNQFLTYTVRQRYYHGRVRDEKAGALTRELTDLMINHILLLEEAERRGFKPDEAKIAKAVAKEEQKHRNDPAWWHDRQRLEEQLKKLVSDQSILDQLEAQVKDVPQVTPAEVRAYYDKHLDLFTEPEVLRLSVILIRVDPGDPDEVWQKAWDKAKGLSDKIKAGADFAEMARQFSDDKTALVGGDMGPVHRGRVPAQIEDGIDKFKVGEVSAPYKGLEGVSIFRLTDRIPPDVKSFDRSEKRAGELLMREKRELAWKTLTDNLHNAAKIEVVTKPMELPITPSTETGTGTGAGTGADKDD